MLKHLFSYYIDACYHSIYYQNIELFEIIFYIDIFVGQCLSISHQSRALCSSARIATVNWTSRDMVLSSMESLKPRCDR